MPDASQFTLGLFDNTALGWSVESPKAAQQGSPSDEDENEGDEQGPAVSATSSIAANFYLDSKRSLARGWPARARDNIAAIRLSKELESTGRAPTCEEQAALIRFVGFGATDLAQNCFPLPGGTGFREGWAEIGQALVEAVTPAEYAALQRSTQYAHYTPEPIIRRLWRAAQRMGFSGGRVLEPGMGTGLFFALLPKALRGTSRLTGIEYDPVTARIARFVHPQARVRYEDYIRSALAGGFDLAIGNPPFADRIVRADPTTAGLGLRLHDYLCGRPGRRNPIISTKQNGSTATSEKSGQMRPYVRPVARLSRWPSWVSLRFRQQSSSRAQGTNNHPVSPELCVSTTVFPSRVELSPPNHRGG
jgi:hypothetical protein